MPTAYSKNDHANGKERHEEILPLASKAGWNVPKTKVDGNDIRQLRYPQKKPCEGNQANHQTGNINNQTEPFSIHGPTPSLNPTLRSAVSYSPLPLSAHCHANRRILVMTWLRLNDAGSASASTASWRGRGFGNSKARPLAPDQHGQTQSATLGASLPSPSVYKLLSDGEKFEVYLRSVPPTPSRAQAGIRAYRGSQS